MALFVPNQRIFFLKHDRIDVAYLDVEGSEIVAIEFVTNTRENRFPVRNIARGCNPFEMGMQGGFDSLECVTLDRTGIPVDEEFVEITDFPFALTRSSYSSDGFWRLGSQPLDCPEKKS